MSDVINLVSTVIDSEGDITTAPQGSIGLSHLTVVCNQLGESSSASTILNIATNTTKLDFELECSNDTITWSASNIFSGMVPGTIRTFYIRLKGKSCVASKSFLIPDCPTCNQTLPSVLTINGANTEYCTNTRQPLLFTASAQNCAGVQWIKHPVITSPVIIGQGNTFAYTGQENLLAIKAVCTSCTGTVESNVISITKKDCSSVEYSATAVKTACVSIAKNNCGANCTGVLYNHCETSTATRTSTVSQAEAQTFANAQAEYNALTLANTNAQSVANLNGNCNCTQTTTGAITNIVQASCSNGGTYAVTISGITNADSYVVCPNINYNCGTHCNAATGTFIGNSVVVTGSFLESVLTAPSVTPHTIRIFDSNNCNSYKDLSVSLSGWKCVSGCTAINSVNIID